MLRQSLNLQKIKPLDKATWAGAVDNLGGDVLAWMASTMNYGGVIAAVGLAASYTLNTTVMPFILRGVSLLGVNSGDVSNPIRDLVWRRLATDLKPPLLKEMAHHPLQRAAFGVRRLHQRQGVAPRGGGHRRMSP